MVYSTAYTRNKQIFDIMLCANRSNCLKDNIYSRVIYYNLEFNYFRKCV